MYSTGQRIFNKIKNQTERHESEGKFYDVMNTSTTTSVPEKPIIQRANNMQVSHAKINMKSADINKVKTQCDSFNGNYCRILKQNEIEFNIFKKQYIYERCLRKVKIDEFNNSNDDIEEIGQVEVLNDGTLNESADIAECTLNNYEKCTDLFKENESFLKIIHFNAQGLLEGAHLESILLLNENLKADIISISESWLNTSIRSGTINIEEYNLYRSDRNFRRHLIKKGGGGVCAYIKREFTVKYIEKSNGKQLSLFDYMILEVKMKNVKFLFCNIYRHGDCIESETNGVLNRIVELSVEYEHVIVC